MTAVERLDDIEVRLLSPMVTYKENATEDAPALVAALHAVLALAQHVLDTESDLEGQTATEARWSVAYAIEHTLTAALDVTS